MVTCGFVWIRVLTCGFVWFQMVTSGYRGYGGYRWCSVVIGGNYLLLVAISSYGWLELIMGGYDWL